MSFAFSLLATAAIDPNPIFDAAAYTTTVATTANGIRQRVEAPGAAPLDVLHVFGSAYERGVAHGTLFAKEIQYLNNVAMPAFYVEEVDSLKDQLSKLPAFLRKLIEDLLLPPLEKAAPAAFGLALTWLEKEQRQWNNVSAADPVYDEVAGIAHGACVATGCADEAALRARVMQINLLPELIQMQCSMMGAWGAATPTGHLTQLRTLDFGEGPFANASVLVVHHPKAAGETGGAGGLARPWASLGFTGYAGVVTGWTPDLSLSQKVDDLYGHPGRPAGAYAGRAVSFVIRDVLEGSSSLEDAEKIINDATRTWGVWLGLGAADSQRFRAVNYTRASAPSFDDTTLPSLTGQTPIDSVAYIDKHPQPSRDPDHTLPKVLQAHRGNLSAAWVASNVPRLTTSGDVHIAVYDLAPDTAAAYLAIGTTAANGSFVRYAYEAPFLRFASKAIFAVPPPASA